MNNSNSSANVDSKNFKITINFITDIIGYYIIPVVSLIGICLNISTSFILKRKELKQYFYKYLWVKSIIDSLICLIGIGYFRSLCVKCQSTKFNSYGILFYQWFVIKINLRTILMVSSLHEIYMITQRYLIIKGKNNWLLNIKLKFYVLFIFLIPILFSSVFFFSIDLVQEKDGSDLYTWNKSEFGETLLMKIWGIVVIVPSSIILVTILTVMNILTVKAFMGFLKNKRKIGNQGPSISIKKSDKRFTRITITLTCFYIITALSEDSVASFIRVINALKIDVSSEVFHILNCIRQLTLLSIFSVHSFDVLIYIPNDKNLVKLMKKIIFGKQQLRSKHR